MEQPRSPASATPPRRFSVLLIDDQPIVGEAVRRMLASERDIDFHYCPDPTRAISVAQEVHPTVILQDLVMPQIDGLTLVRFLRANPDTRDIPLVVLSSKEEGAIKAQAFGLGANDYMVKLPDPLELIARVRYHSQGYVHLLERNQAYEDLARSRQLLSDELANAARYVLSLLPPPLAHPVRAEWRYIPSMELGGDAIGYHWIDESHLAVYLLDVCGHGVGAALHSMSAMNTLRMQTLPDVDFHDPSDVLQGLNRVFQMSRYNQVYFTIWYGVYNTKTRTLTCASGGHPPAVLVVDGQPREIETQGPIIGCRPEARFASAQVVIPPQSRLYVFCDGVFEIERPDGSFWSVEGFIDLLRQEAPHGMARVEHILGEVRKVRGGSVFDDDFSLIELTL